MSEPCVFCAIAAGTEPAHVVHADSDAVAFLDIAPVRRGHTLVVPRAHVPDLLAPGSSAAMVGVASALRATACLLTERLPADGITLFQANGVAAGQEVFHLHVHLVPRRHGEQRLVSFERDTAEAARLAETAALLT